MHKYQTNKAGAVNKHIYLQYVQSLYYFVYPSLKLHLIPLWLFNNKLVLACIRSLGLLCCSQVSAASAASGAPSSCASKCAQAKAVMRSTFCGSRVQSKWDKDTVDKASNHSIIAITYHQHIRLSSSDKTLPGLQRRSGQCRGHFFAVEAARQLLKPTSGLGCSRDTVHGHSKHHCGRTNPAAVQTPHLVPAPTVRTEAISSEWVAVQAGRGAWHDGPLYWVCTVYSMLSSVKIPHTC